MRKLSKSPIFFHPVILHAKGLISDIYHGNSNRNNDNNKKIPLINLITTIYFTNHQKRQFVNFLKKYPCILYVKNYLGCKFKKFALE